METLATIERNEIFDLAFRFVTETNETIFLTGKAGTGKTTFLKYLKEHCCKNIVVAAPTGVAAINAGGVTLHSLFQLPFHPFLPTSSNREEFISRLKLGKQRLELLRKMELLVIDEISMVRCDTLDAIDTLLRSVRRNHELPFGGVQLLCIGDLFQLPPVAQRQEWSILQEYYSSPFFFDSLVIKEQMPLLIELTKIYRQKEDSFVRLLNKVRTNNMDADDFEDLHMRFYPDFRPQADENFITLTSHNNQADQINTRELNKLLPSAYTYYAEIEDEFPENSFPAERELVLKTGAQVMFLKNDVVEKKFFNGKIGIVKKLYEEKIIVECDDAEIEVSRDTWENNRYVLNRSDGKLEQETVGTFTQFPLRLAWAITIHKSQGLTFENVMIDAAQAFSSGQVYVALSRCTSLDGIVLLSKIPPTAIQSSQSVSRGQQTLTHKGSLVERFAGARQIFSQNLLEEIFSFKEMVHTADVLAMQANNHRQKLKEDGLAWVLDFKNKLHADQRVGLRFIMQINSLLKEEAVVEDNKTLQERLRAAANHFEAILSGYLKEIQDNPVITESRDTAGVLNELLKQLYRDVFIYHYYLEFCKTSFSVPDFLRHKLNLVNPRINISCYAGNKSEAAPDSSNPVLFNTLKRWRDMVCQDGDLPIYMVANQKTLQEIATYLPSSKKELLSITGFGKAKVDKYGDDLLEAILQYCEEYAVESNMEALRKPGKKTRPEKDAAVVTNTKEVSYNLFKEGKSLREISVERKMALATVEGHLSAYIISGQIDVSDLVSSEKQLLIRQAAQLYKDSGFKVMKEHLPQEISYGEIRMVLAADEKG